VSRVDSAKPRSRRLKATTRATGKAAPPAKRRPQAGGNGLVGLEAGVFDSIRAAIVEQRLPPGTKLTEDGIGEIYDVSRARIRRVLLSLSHEKVVNLLPGRGAFVATPLPAEARDVFAARRLLEGALLTSLRRPPSAAVLIQLRRLLAEEQAATRRQDRPEMIRLSGEFHIAVARWVGNPVIADMLKGLVSRSSLVIAMYEASGSVCCIANDHELLIEALAAGRGSHAAAIMLRHLSRIEAGLDLDREPDRATDLRQLLMPVSAKGDRSRQGGSRRLGMRQPAQ
jgi:DNA-binding GntR family transcriptional regulator